MKNIENTIELRVRYEETDKMGVVYSAKYFVYFEVGRTELMRYFGKTYREIEDLGIKLPVIETYCRHKKPATYDDLLIIKTKAFLKKSIMRFDYEIKKKNEDDIVSEGWSIHCFIDNNNKIINAPDFIKNIFK